MKADVIHYGPPQVLVSAELWSTKIKPHFLNTTEIIY